MIRGMYASTSNMISLMRQQEVISHNLANMNTPGFKQLVVPTREAGELALTPNAGGSLSYSIGGLPMGVNSSESLVDYTQGPLENTGRPLDLAILGDGFFRVQTPQGERLTRNGTFQRDAAGNLCTDEGYLLLGENGPIQIGQGTPTIMDDGHIYMPGEEEPAGRIALVRVDDLGALTADESGMFDAGNAGVQVMAGAETAMKQGFREQANVDISGTMVNMMRALRSYEATQRSFQLQDQALQELMDVGRT
jgi:flagellar basal-body rod protein FlgF